MCQPEMRVCGVVAEYDPFHKGHERLLTLIREQLHPDYILCVLSGCFTQRGQGALLFPADRAEAALSCGTDVVVELPVPWAVREAEHFALGAVSVLHRMGCVTDLAFGAETADLSRLQTVARLLEQPDERLTAHLREGLDGGLGHPAAMARAVENVTDNDTAALLRDPNNILALCYLRALLRLDSAIAPHAFAREGAAYHDSAVTDALPSATAVRGALTRGAWPQAESSLPPSSYALTRRAYAQQRVFRADLLDAPLLHLLRTAPEASFAAYAGYDEGLCRRLAEAARRAVSREELLDLAGTKRYPRARLSRLCTQLLLQLDDTLLRPELLPPYTRLLGFRASAAPLLRAMKKGGLPIYEKAADAPRTEPVLQADARAYDLWCLGAGIPAGLLFTQKLVKL